MLNDINLRETNHTDLRHDLRNKIFKKVTITKRLENNRIITLEYKHKQNAQKTLIITSKIETIKIKTDKITIKLETLKR